MKFLCEKATLTNAISIVSRTVSPKSSLAFLEGIYLAAGEDLRLTGYNLETGITVRLDATIRRTGECVMPARMFADIVRKLPEDVVSVEVDENYRVTIKGGVASFQLMATAADEYPQLPSVEEENAVRLPQKALRDLISGTIFAVSEDTANPIYTGCLVETREDSITMVAIDGYRMAKRAWHQQDAAFPAMSFVVPSAALKELEKILESDEEKELRFTLGKKHISFEMDNATLICRLLEGKFAEWRRNGISDSIGA